MSKVKSTTDTIEFLEKKEDFQKYNIKRDFRFGQKFKVKSIGTGKDLYIKGYASTVDKDRVDDIVTHEAIQKSKDDLVRDGSSTVFFNHNKNFPIGVVTATNVDEKGLIVNIKISNAEDVKDIRTKIKEKVLKSLSIGGRFKKVQVERDDEGQVTGYKVLEMELMEVSVVGVPANSKASIFSVVEKSFKSLFDKEENNMGKKEKNHNDGQINNDNRTTSPKTGTEQPAATKPSNDAGSALSNDARKEVETIISKTLAEHMEHVHKGLSTISAAVTQLHAHMKENMPQQFNDARKEGESEQKKDMPDWAKKIQDDMESITKGMTEINKTLGTPAVRKGAVTETGDEDDEQEEEETEESEVPKKVIKSIDDEETMQYLNYIFNKDTEEYEKLSDTEKQKANAIYMQYYDKTHRKS